MTDNIVVVPGNFVINKDTVLSRSGRYKIDMVYFPVKIATDPGRCF